MFQFLIFRNAWIERKHAKRYICTSLRHCYWLNATFTNLHDLTNIFTAINLTFQTFEHPHKAAMILKFTFLIYASLQLYFMCTFLQIISSFLTYPEVFKTNPG